MVRKGAEMTMIATALMRTKRMVSTQKHLAYSSEALPGEGVKARWQEDTSGRT